MLAYNNKYSFIAYSLEAGVKYAVHFPVNFPVMIERMVNYI